MDDALADGLEQFQALELVKLLGAQSSENEYLSKALETGDVLYGGDWKEPDYRTLIREKAKLALMTAQVLPLNADVLASRASAARRFASTDSSSSVIWSALKMVGTIRPRGVSQAKPRFTLLK